MKRKTGISLLFWLISTQAWCVCRVPQPRMVCAEYSQSKAVVLAKLVGVTSVPKDDPDYFIYKLSVVRTLRGQAPQSIKLYEGNDSGRATFDWKLNKKYLLFLIQPNPATHNDWTIDGCGNSAPFAKADAVLRQLQGNPSARKDGIIAGMVGTDSWTKGVPGVTVRISGVHQTLEVKTDDNGRFSQVVPVGTYKITAVKNGTVIGAEPFSHENPEHVVIDSADVHRCNLLIHTNK